MEFTLADVQKLLEPFQLTLQQINERLARLEQSQNRTNENLMIVSDRYSEIKADVRIVQNDMSGFIKRYEERHQELEKSVTENWNDINLKIQNCRESCPLNDAKETEKFRKRNEVLRFIMTIGGLVIGLAALIIVLTLWASEQKLIHRNGNTIELSGTNR